jgi:hypothetical protein
VVGWSEPDFQASVGCALIVRSVPDSLAVMVKLIRWAFREKVKTGSWNKSNLCAITIWTKVDIIIRLIALFGHVKGTWGTIYCLFERNSRETRPITSQATIH